MKEKRKRILQVNIDNNGGNGAFSLIYYLYSVLCDEYIFDFFTMGEFIESNEAKLIKKEGGIIFSAKLRSNRLLGHLKLPFVFAKFLQEHQYEIIHVHSEVAYKVFLYVVVARIIGVKRIIVHAHSANVDGDFRLIKKIAHKLTKGIVNAMATDFISISEAPAKWLFTSKVIDDPEHFRYVTNGIQVEKYRFDEKKRELLKRKYDLSGKIIGHVGAFKKVKNQGFLLEILSYLKKTDLNYKLLLVGDGESRLKLQEQTQRLHLENDVVFLGARDDVDCIMQLFDVLVFPSLFEGIPMTIIEAQAVGMPIVASEAVKKEVVINTNVKILSLNDDVSKWAEVIEKIIDNHIGIEGNNNVLKSKYNIINGAQQLRAIYGRKCS